MSVATNQQARTAGGTRLATGLVAAVCLVLSSCSTMNAQSATATIDDADSTARSEPQRTNAQKPAQQPVANPLTSALSWVDVRFFRGWRIEQNVATNEFRLLDPSDERQATGSLLTCSRKLDAIGRSEHLLPMHGKAVIVVHGIIRSSKTFSSMRPALEKAGYMVVPFDYPSTRIDIDAAAGYLNRVIESLDGVERIDFVVHSMGGLVTRAYLKQHRDRRIGRMVMLGVPNRGAELADLLRNNLAYETFIGPAGQELGTNADGLIPKLPIPDFEFAIIAGGAASGTSFNPLIPGDNDMIVSVESARLPGAADFLLIQSLHSLLPANSQAIAATVRFLKMGHLRADGVRHPIE